MPSREKTAGVEVVDSTAISNAEYHEQTGSYRTEFDCKTRSASDAVVTAVATATGTDPLELPPIYSVLDSEALDKFFTSVTSGRDHGESTITFEYFDHSITVNGHGTVIVDPCEEFQS